MSQVVSGRASVRKTGDQKIKSQLRDKFSLNIYHMLEREWSAESNGKQPHLLIPDKTAALVPKFSVENLPWFLRLQ